MMIVRQIPVGPMENFDYLLMDDASKEAVALIPVGDGSGGQGSS